MNAITEAPSEYKLLAEFTEWELEARVNDLLTMGWRLHGGPVCRGDGKYVQAMVR